ncbi:MAG: hypothetical protein ABII18_05580 [bacterium]
MSNQTLQIDFSRDLKNLLLNQLKSGGYHFNRKLELSKIVQQYFNITLREIKATPRTINISNRLKKNMPFGNVRRAFDNIIKLAESGRNMNHYQSKELINPDYKDRLLYDWGIYHLHLGLCNDHKDPRFIARTKDLLFVIVNDADFYCIDILDHDPIDSFANQELIETAHHNWPSLLSRHKINAIKVSPNKFLNANINTLRKSGVSYIFTVADGTMYISAGGGYATDGSSISVQMHTDKLLKSIRDLKNTVIKNEKELRSQINHKTGINIDHIKLKLMSWDNNTVTVLEENTKLNLNIPWV